MYHRVSTRVLCVHRQVCMSHRVSTRVHHHVMYHRASTRVLCDHHHHVMFHRVSTRVLCDHHHVFFILDEYLCLHYRVSTRALSHVLILL